METIVTLPNLRNLIITDYDSQRFIAVKVLKQELNLNKGRLVSRYLLQNDSKKKLYLSLDEVLGQKERNQAGFHYEIESVDY